MAERTEELKRDIEDTRAHMTGTLDEIGDRVSPGKIAERRVNRIKESGSRLSTAVMGAPRSAAGKTSSAMGDAQGSASEALSSAAQAVTDAPGRVKDTTAGNPIAAGAVAFGLGVLIGSMAPASREEEQVAGQLMEPIQKELTDAGQQVASTVKDQVTDSIAETKEHLASATEEIKQHATESVETVRSDATDAKDQVASDVKEG